MEEEKKIEENLEETKEEIREEMSLDPDQEKDKKIKNLISAVILLTGLFLGSLFVDIVQLVKGGGFSQRALKNAEVLESGGKTWVAYAEPMVRVKVVSDDSCDQCSPDEVLIGLKQALPTMSNEKIDINSVEGKKLVEEFGIKTIPAFIFSNEIEKTELFAKAEPFLDKKENGYAIKTAEAGFPVGKYVATPEILERDIKLGSDEAKVKVITFVNFQNPADKTNYQSVVSALLKDYADKVQVVIKSYIPSTATQAKSAAIAASCANEQGKFVQYAEKLFTSQDSWGKAKDATGFLKGYAATLALNTTDFNKCLEEKKYEEVINKTLTDGQAFGIQATPAMFVSNEFSQGQVKYEDVKKIVDEKLNQ